MNAAAALTPRQRWLALYVLCIGVLMIVLDTTVVTVALPTIETDLGFSGSTLVWVLNAYMLTFGGCLLLGGRLGDLYGQRRWFLIGLVLFTLASLACGLAGTQLLLITARAVQGLAGAVVSAVALSLIVNLFTDAGERAKAMGIYGFICAAGGSLGEVLGGVITDLLSWNWIFLINLPIGIAVYALCVRLLPQDTLPQQRGSLDIGGALAVTLGLMLAIYAIVDGNRAGWASTQTLVLLGGSAVLMAAFIAIEAQVREPLMPLRLFRSRNLSASNVIAVLWAAGMFAWFVITALYLQNVLGYSAMHVGFAFLPADALMAVFSAGLSAKMVMRFGLRLPMWLGLLIAAVGLLLFARMPLHGEFVADVLPGMLLLGLGGGMAFNPLLLAAMNDAEASESGVASGIVNTAFMLGGALGLAALASLAEARTIALRADGAADLAALQGGYQLAFLIGALGTALAAALAAGLIRESRSPQVAHP